MCNVICKCVIIKWWYCYLNEFSLACKIYLYLFDTIMPANFWLTILTASCVRSSCIRAKIMYKAYIHHCIIDSFIIPYVKLLGIPLSIVLVPFNLKLDMFILRYECNKHASKHCEELCSSICYGNSKFDIQPLVINIIGE